MEDKERQEFRKLPSVTELSLDTRKEVMQLLEELDEVSRNRIQLSIREDHLKDELERIQKGTGKTGFRHGWLCFMAQKVAGRRTLDKMLLLENGCPAAVLNASYKEGKPTTRVSFKHLEEEI